METGTTSLSCLTADGTRHAQGGASQKHTHIQETGSVIQYRPNHSSLPKSRLDGEPTLWGENKILEPKKKGRGGLEGICGEKSETLLRAKVSSKTAIMLIMSQHQKQRA